MAVPPPGDLDGPPPAGPGAPVAFCRGEADDTVFLRRTADGWKPARVTPVAHQNSGAVADCLVQGYPSPPETLDRDLVALRPGEGAAIDAAGRLVTSLPPPPVPQPGGLRAALLQVLEGLEVAQCGVLLSGGLDSSWLLALAARHRKVVAYTTLFQGVTQLDYGAEVAAAVSVPRRVIEAGAGLVEAWRQLVDETGVPQSSLGGAALLLAARAAAKDGITLLLSGLGADEVVGGRLVERRLPGLALRRAPRLRWSRGEACQAYRLDVPELRSWRARMRLRAGLFAPERRAAYPFLAAVPPAPVMEPEHLAALTPAVAHWLWAYYGRLGASRLPTLAAISRLTGVRIVTPYLTAEVVRRGLASPSLGKATIRIEARHDLPEAVRTRAKRWRRRPDATWLLANPLPAVIHRALAPGALADLAWFDPVAVHHSIQQVRRQPDCPLNWLRTQMLLTIASLQRILAGP